MTGKGRYGEEVMCVYRSRGGVSVPLASCFGPLLVILERDDKEDQQGDALDPCQEEEVVVQRAVVDITWEKERKQEHYRMSNTWAETPNS